MIRLILALTASLGLVCPLSASLTPHQPRLSLGHEVQANRVLRIGALAPARTAEAEMPNDFFVTEETEVLLNGKPCSYAQIPAHASIVFMEVGADKKTVLKVHFRVVK